MSKEDKEWAKGLNEKVTDKELEEFFKDDNIKKADGRKEGDWGRLERANWEELAFYVWYDTVKNKDGEGHKHAQKWHGMLTARLLAKLDEGGKQIERLTIAATGLAVIETLSSVISNHPEEAAVLTRWQIGLAVVLLIIVLMPSFNKVALKILRRIRP